MSNDPQIIRTVGELEALDPDTYLIDKRGDSLDKAGWVCEIFDGQIFPLVIIATGEHVRAARKALKERE